MLTFYTISNKSLGWKPPSILERAIKATGFEKPLFLKKNVLKERFSKLQPKAVMAPRSMNVKYFLIRKRLFSPLLLPFITFDFEKDNIFFINNSIIPSLRFFKEQLQMYHSSISFPLWLNLLNKFIHNWWKWKQFLTSIISCSENNSSVQMYKIIILTSKNHIFACDCAFHKYLFHYWQMKTACIINVYSESVAGVKRVINGNN